MNEQNRIRQEIMQFTFREGATKLASGKESEFYFDMRALHENPTLRTRFLTSFMESFAIHDELLSETDVIGGVQTGGASFAAMLADRLVLPYSWVRKEPKKHGNELEVIAGAQVAGRNVLAFEDVLTSGDSIKKDILAYRNEGAIVKNAMAHLVREDEALQALADIGVNVIYFIGPDEAHAFAESRLTQR